MDTADDGLNLFFVDTLYDDYEQALHLRLFQMINVISFFYTTTGNVWRRDVRVPLAQPPV